MDYTTLSHGDKVLQARDSLRAIETDHYRLSIRPTPGSEERLAQLEAERDAVAAVLTELLENPPEEPSASPEQPAGLPVVTEAPPEEPVVEADVEPEAPDEE